MTLAARGDHHFSWKLCLLCCRRQKYLFWIKAATFCFSYSLTEIVCIGTCLILPIQEISSFLLIPETPCLDLWYLKIKIHQCCYFRVLHCFAGDYLSEDFVCFTFCHRQSAKINICACPPYHPPLLWLPEHSQHCLLIGTAHVLFGCVGFFLGIYLTYHLKGMNSQYWLSSFKNSMCKSSRVERGC